MDKTYKKIKFKPVVTRIKLNPEQALLACAPKFRGPNPLVGSVVLFT